jgi:hypothetical protein
MGQCGYHVSRRAHLDVEIASTLQIIASLMSVEETVGQEHCGSDQANAEAPAGRAVQQPF